MRDVMQNVTRAKSITVLPQSTKKAMNVQMHLRVLIHRKENKSSVKSPIGNYINYF